MRLLGTPQICCEDTWQNVVSRKIYLLIFYLAYKGIWISRDELANLFYPKSDLETARVNLRSLLKRLRKMPLCESLQVEGHSLRFLVDTDTKTFIEASSKHDWQSVIELYKGEFLKGFHNKNVGIGAWLELERQNLRDIYQSSAINLALVLKQKKLLAKAIQVLTRALQENLFNEEMVQLYMECAYLAGKRWEALKTFEDFKAELENDLNIPPLLKTLKLAEQIKQNEKIQ